MLDILPGNIALESKIGMYELCGQKEEAGNDRDVGREDGGGCAQRGKGVNDGGTGHSCGRNQVSRRSKFGENGGSGAARTRAGQRHLPGATLELMFPPGTVSDWLLVSSSDPPSFLPV